MSRKIFRSFFILVLVIGSMAVQAPQSARAAGPWYVSTTGDDNNDCLSPSTACATINGALAKPGFVPGDTVRVAIGTYTGTGSEVVLLDKNVTLTGGWDASFTTQSGMSTIDGQGARRGITVNSGVTAIIMRLTVQNGFSFYGGGIYNGGTLTLNSSTVSGNASSDSGGGILNFSGALALTTSTVSNNTSYLGGGILSRDGGTIALTNSIVSNNTSNGGNGGGINNNSSNSTVILTSSIVSGNSASTGGGIINNGSLSIANSTISGNTATFGGGIENYGLLTSNNNTISNNSASIYPGGIFFGFGTFGSATLSNTILAGNYGLAGFPDCSGGTLNSQGYNLIQDVGDCSITGDTTGNLLGVDPLLGPLQDNGGSTFTHALLPGSPAIDAGNPAGCIDQDGNALTTDQRGVARPQGTACDIGAFELEAVSQGMQVTIDIIPGSRANAINLKHDRWIPVAILSTADFNAPEMVNRDSLTFGKTGGEDSLLFCLKHGMKVNRDRLPDLVCYFRVSKTGFEFGNTEGILKGMTVENISFEGNDSVKILKKSRH